VEDKCRAGGVTTLVCVLVPRLWGKTHDVDGLISSYLRAGLGVRSLALGSVHDQVDPDRGSRVLVGDLSG
jgi:hypothetical protein